MINIDNSLYNNNNFQLIKCGFSNCDRGGYTYACHVNYKIKPGDLVVVTTGDYNPLDFESMKVVKVNHVTSNLKYIPEDYQLKHIVTKVKMGVYKKLLNARKTT